MYIFLIIYVNIIVFSTFDFHDSHVLSIEIKLTLNIIFLNSNSSSSLYFLENITYYDKIVKNIQGGPKKSL